MSFPLQVQPPDSAGPLHPNLALRYSTHKNLANIASQEGDSDTAIENYLEVDILKAPMDEQLRNRSTKFINFYFKLFGQIYDA